MIKNDYGEKEAEIEIRKIWTKKLNKFLNDYFSWVIIGATAAVCILGFFFLLLPEYVQTTKYITAINQREKLDYQEKNSELTKIKDLLDIYAGIDQKYLSKMSSVAPIKKNKEELFSEINYLVSKNQLFLVAVSLSDEGTYQTGLLPEIPAEVQTAAGIEAVTINLSVRGTDYEAFKNFLASLENNLHLMDVQSVVFDPVGKSTGLTLSTYYFKQ
jgi:Tfp pilus assembly protein PilO